MPPSDIPHASWIDVLRKVGTERSFECDETIFVQGQADQGIRYILAGTAHAICLSADGEQTWLGKMGVGEFLGDTAFLTGTPMGYEIVAATRVRIISISAPVFRRLLDENPCLYRDLAIAMAIRLDKFARRQVEAATLSAPGRICAELERLSRPIGIEPGKLIIRPNPVFSDLGVQLGTSRETVSRTVSDLQKRNIISRTAGAIIIEDLAALRALMK